ncbi:hypothetical protein [Thalassospira povalilytica]|uniref:hypothetical protein n=1 Tax=Thalassospira povalilytica TaxID=732237 RepID=UPI003AA92B49
MELWQLWLIEVVPNVAGSIQAILAITCVLWLIVLLMSAAVYESLMPTDNPISKVTFKLKRLVFASLAVFVLLFAIPSSSGMYRIVGGYVATNIEGIEELPKNLINAANDWAKSVSQESE